MPQISSKRNKIKSIKEEVKEWKKMKIPVEVEDWLKDEWKEDWDKVFKLFEDILDFVNDI